MQPLSCYNMNAAFFACQEWRSKDHQTSLMSERSACIQVKMGTLCFDCLFWGLLCGGCSAFRLIKLPSADNRKRRREVPCQHQSQFLRHTQDVLAFLFTGRRRGCLAGIGFCPQPENLPEWRKLALLRYTRCVCRVNRRSTPDNDCSIRD